MVKKVKCIDDVGDSRRLTYGKEYNVVEEVPSFYRIIDDLNEIGGFYKNRFEPVEEQEPKIKVGFPVDPNVRYLYRPINKEQTDAFVELLEELSVETHKDLKEYRNLTKYGEPRNVSFCGGSFLWNISKEHMRDEAVQWIYLQGDTFYMTDRDMNLSHSGEGYSISTGYNNDETQGYNNQDIIMEYQQTETKLYNMVDKVEELLENTINENINKTEDINMSIITSEQILILKTEDGTEIDTRTLTKSKIHAMIAETKNELNNAKELNEGVDSDSIAEDIKKLQSSLAVLVAVLDGGLNEEDK